MIPNSFNGLLSPLEYASQCDRGKIVSISDNVHSGWEGQVKHSIIQKVSQATVQKDHCGNCPIALTYTSSTPYQPDNITHCVYCQTSRSKTELIFGQSVNTLKFLLEPLYQQLFKQLPHSAQQA
ncbi:hypothetical protein J6590_002929 [Homalodisca vitripennis]|nr:hypothetical protein J6590_002929 [Homalodisca vitripennis]